MKVHIVISPYPKEGIVHVICSPKDNQAVTKIFEEAGIEFLELIKDTSSYSGREE